jgi:hypothetical protein
MGRQIAIAMTRKDEALFLEFLQSTVEIRLIESFAPSIDELFVDGFASELANHWTYDIWNTRFHWNPVYNRVGERAYIKEHIGWHYISNKNAAPVIEFRRSDVRQGKYGRIYWAKYFSAPDGLDYDVDEFSKWYDSIVRWVKKTSGGKVRDAWTTYFLPDAWESK